MKKNNWRVIFLLLALCHTQSTLATPTTPASDFIDNGDGTVTHKLTELVWQRCSVGQKWTGSTCTGTAKTFTWDAAMALKSNFAGKSDWRVPNEVELNTIVERDAYNPAINSAIFPNPPSNYPNNNTFFWSSSPNASNSSIIWIVDFNDGWGTGSRDKYNSYAVRLVRGGQCFGIGNQTSPNASFVDNGDGTATHKCTGLVWQRCTVGQIWDTVGKTCIGTGSAYTWDAAMALTSNFVGKADWRLPNANELHTIEDYSLYPSINTTLFPYPCWFNCQFWSSSSNARSSGHPWIVDFVLGGYGFWKGNNAGVRLVRSGQYISTANLDMTNVNCRYVAPFYNAMWQQMKVKKAPSCQAALNYYTWTKFTLPENDTASDYYSNRLNGIDTSNQLFNQRLELIDNSLSVIEDVLDPDLRALLTPKTYTKNLKFMKSKGIVKSLAKGATPFSRKSPTGRLLDKFFKEKLLAKTSGTVFCSVMFKDNPAVSKSCSNETEKAFACAAGLLTKFDSITAPISIWKDAATCVTGGVTSFVGFVKNIFDVGQIVDIKQHTYGYILISDYLNDYYAKGSTSTALDEAKLEADIQKYADKLYLSSGGLFTFADFDMQFVKDGIRDSILRNLVTANANIRTVEQIRAILYK